MKKFAFAGGALIFLIIVWTTLNAPVGIVNINSDPEGASVTIDDVPRGTTPLEVSLTVGKHNIVVTKEGYTGYVSSLDVEKGETKELNVKLEKTS